MGIQKKQQAEAGKRMKMSKKPGGRLTVMVMLFYFTAFLLLALRNAVWQGYALALCVPAAIWGGTHILGKCFHIDTLLFSLTNFLCALGILILYDTNPVLAYHQVVYYGVGLVGMVICIYFMRAFRTIRHLGFVMIAVSFAFLALPLLIGRETYGAKNWIYFHGVSIQPSEFVKILLILILAWFMSRRQFIPWFLCAVGCLLFLMLQKDLGTALLYYGVTLLLFFASTANLPLTLLGMLGGGGAAVMGYRMFAHVKKRVAIWRNPWSDYENAGYQIVQSLMALASGSLLGVGLGLGSPTTIPVYETDFIFSVICEQFGLIFGVCVLLIYVAVIWRGTTIAMASRHSFQGLAAMGATMMIGLQTFIIIGGVIKLIPLTGITMPFVSSGGSSLVSNMCLTGLIQGVASLNEDDLEEDLRLTEM